MLYTSHSCHENITTRKRHKRGGDDADRDIEGIERKIERQTQADTQRDRDKEGEKTKRADTHVAVKTLSKQQAGATPLPTRPLVPSYPFVQLGKRSLNSAAVGLELFKCLLVLLERLAVDAELL